MIFSKDHILELHQRLIETTGGKPGIRDVSSLDAAINSAYQTFDKKELYSSIIEKACRMSFALNRAQAFNDGNKRIAMHVLALYLRIHDVNYRPSNKEVVRVGEAVANHDMDYSELLEWVKNTAIK